MDLNSLRTFFTEKLNQAKLFEFGIFLCRHDGVLLAFHKGEKTKDADEISTGALLSGVFQGAKALVNFMTEKKDIFRFGLDTSSKGVYILPINAQNSEFYLALLYQDEENPGFLKSRFRKLAQEIETFFLENKNEEKKDAKAYDGPFNNISDDEIDHMFKFARIN